jgi:hypothetical protein
MLVKSNNIDKFGFYGNSRWPMNYNRISLVFSTVLVLLFSVSIIAQSSNSDLVLPIESNVKATITSVTSNNINLNLNANQRLISPVTGSLHLACYNETSASLRLSNNQGLTIFIYPVAYSTIKVKLNQDININKGDFIGDYNPRLPINDKCDPTKESGLNITTRKIGCPYMVNNIVLNCGMTNVNINSATNSTNSNGGCDLILAAYYNIGQRSQEVSNLQKCLKDIGLFNYPGGITGYFGNYTNSVYNSFLTSNNNICQILKKSNYTFGERSERVKRLQQCLRDVNKFNYPTNTGMFGPITQAGFKAWL